MSALVMIVTIALTYPPLRRIHEAEGAAAFPRLPLGTVLKQFLPTLPRTPNIYVVIAVTLLVFSVLSTSNVLTLHLSTYYWQLEGQQIRDVQLAQVPGTIVAALLATRVIRRLDKKRTMIFGVAGFCACVLLPVLLPLVGALPPAGTAELARVLMALPVLEGLTYGSFLVATGATAADIADEHEANMGRPQQGALPGVTFFCTKASSALINLAVGVLLDLIRFPVGAKVADVPQAQVEQLAIFTCVVVSAAAVLLVWVDRPLRHLGRQAASHQRTPGRTARRAPARRPYRRPRPAWQASPPAPRLDAASACSAACVGIVVDVTIHFVARTEIVVDQDSHRLAARLVDQAHRTDGVRVTPDVSLVRGLDRRGAGLDIRGEPATDHVHRDSLRGS